MAQGDLTYKDFWKLTSEEERSRKYGELTEHDKFLIRISERSGAKSPPCNQCRYYRGFAKCDAYPEGISGSHIGEVEKNIDCDCGNGYKFTINP